MISFRYHLVSIVAVFLALALGVLLGTTVVNQGIIDDLRNRTDSAAQNAANLRNQVNQLENELGTDHTFENLVMPLLVKDQLAGTSLVLVTQQDVRATQLEAVRQALTEAGAAVVAEVVVTNRMALSDGGSRSALASALGVGDSGVPDQLAEEAAVALAGRLAGGPGQSGPDLIDSLVAGGFLVVRGGTGSTADIGGPSQPVVSLAGGGSAPLVAPSLFLAPLVRQLVQASQPVAAAEMLDAVAPFVQLLRQDSQLDGHLVTVDNADETLGQIALVLALHNLLTPPGSGGDYGVKPGASALMPTP